MKRQIQFEFRLFQIMSALVLTNLIAISESHPLLQLAALKRIAHRERRNVMPITIAPSVKSARLCSGQSSGHTSTSDVSLCYKNGWFLAISDDGTVNGTSNVQSPDIKLQLRSVGSSLVRIYSPHHCLYVAMASNGKVFTTEHPSDETVFKQTHEPSGFQTFASQRHFTRIGKHVRFNFLSMRKTGHMKNGKKSQRHHRTTLLSVMPARETF